MDSYLYNLISPLIADVAAIRIETIEGDAVRLLQLSVAQPDLSRVIGKHGRTAEALRTLLHAASMKQTGKRTKLEILQNV